MVGAMELALGHRRSASLVIVGFSTAFQNQAEVLGRIIEALSTLRVRAVVTLGPALNITDLAAAPNVFVCRSAPHNQLLPQSPAVVTHAGHGTVIRSSFGAFASRPPRPRQNRHGISTATSHPIFL
jgi:UDP:flavonoid glycosyltransferase YjiC (YdhE family)